jgi:hypothetical protein
MSDVEMITNLAEQYVKHKWVLRRVLLSERSFGELSETLKSRFPDAEISLHEIDAIWYSRMNKDSETWELRRIGSPPFALVEVIDHAVSAEERENVLASLEHEMADQQPPAREH